MGGRLGCWGTCGCILCLGWRLKGCTLGITVNQRESGKKKKSKRQSRQALASGRDIQGLRESQYLKIELGNARLLVGQEPQRSHENSVGCKLVLEVIFKCND